VKNNERSRVVLQVEKREKERQKQCEPQDRLHFLRITTLSCGNVWSLIISHLPFVVVVCLVLPVSLFLFVHDPPIILIQII